MFSVQLSILVPVGEHKHGSRTAKSSSSSDEDETVKQSQSCNTGKKKWSSIFSLRNVLV